MQDVLSKLPPSSFRGIEFPITERDVSFSHANARHKLMYRNGELVETTGAQAWTFSYTIPCRQGLIYTNYGNLFTETLPKLVRALRDKEPGPLIDPVYGEFQVVPSTFNDTIDVTKRDGTDIRIELIHAPDIDDVDAGNEVPAFQGIEAAVSVINKEIQIVPWEQELPPKPLVNPFQAVRGVVERSQQSVQNTLAQLERVIDEAKRVETAIDNLGKPETFALNRRARKAQLAAHQSHRNIRRPDKKIGKIVNTQARGVSQVAASVGMSLQDFLRVNPELAGLLMVPAGQAVFVARAA